jgi:hypothetical protein
MIVILPTSNANKRIAAAYAQAQAIIPATSFLQAIPETGDADPHFDSSQNLSTFLHRDSTPMTAKKSSMLIILGIIICHVNLSTKVV